MNSDQPFDLRLAPRYLLVDSGGIDAASAVIERLHGPFSARARHGEARDAVRIRSAELGALALSNFTFGRSVDIVPGGLGDALLVTTTIKGSLAMDSGGLQLAAGVGESLITQAEDAPTFIYGPDTEVLKLRFERARLEELSTRLYGDVGAGRLHFETAMAMPGAARRWIALAHYLVATLNEAEGAPLSPRAMAALEEHVMLTLLELQPHSRARPPACNRPVPAVRHFHAAREYIERHIADELTLAGIADAAHCSLRSLARAFAGAGETAPMRYVHRLRLQRIRAELQSTAFTASTIAEIALRWGCTHIGEFNRSYLQAFGETPSATRKGALPALHSGTNTSPVRQASARHREAERLG